MYPRGLLSIAALGGLVACGGEVALGTTESASIVLQPTSYNFGAVQAGASSAAAVFTVRATLQSSDTVSAVNENCPDFVVTAQNLPADIYRECEPGVAAQICSSVEYTFTARFTPTIAGPLSCAVTIVLGTGNQTLSLIGTGTAPPRDIDVIPGSLAFGDVRIATDSTAAGVTVRNLGTGPLTVSSATVSGGYVLGGPAAFTVAGSGSQALTVTCHPTAVGPLGGQLVLQSDDPSTPTVTVPLDCRGVDSALAISPSPAVYATRVGEPIRRTIRVMNSGGAATTVLGVTLDGSGLALVTAPPANTPLPANGGFVDVEVGFAAGTEGEVSGTLNVQTPEGTRSSQVTIQAALATMSISPDGAIDVGPVCVGDTARRSFTAIGNGGGGFIVTAMSDPGAPFALTHPALPATIEPKGANRLTFELATSPTAPGPATSAFEVATDIPNEGPRRIEVAVTALAAGVTATPGDLDLGSRPIGVASIGQAVQLTNCTTGDVTVGEVTIEGPDAADFAIVVPPTSTMLAPRTTIEWVVVLVPHVGGPKQASLVITTSAGTQTVALYGEGQIDTPDADEARSYYTCSSGGAGGAIPGALLALLALGRRPRRRGAA